MKPSTDSKGLLRIGSETDAAGMDSANTVICVNPLWTQYLHSQDIRHLVNLLGLKETCSMVKTTHVSFTYDCLLLRYVMHHKLSRHQTG
jgi:hypothetical protein